MPLKEDLQKKIQDIIIEKLDESTARVIPTVDSIELQGGAKSLNASFLYADLANSSVIATRFQKDFSAKIIKIYLACMCLLIRKHSGIITSFDGDRVMGVFIGDNNITDATLCALKMNCALVKIINPQVYKLTKNYKARPFNLKHCIGIDTSEVRVIRAGIRGSNDLVWIGRAPNLAAKLSEKKNNNDVMLFISNDVFKEIADVVKFKNKNLKRIKDINAQIINPLPPILGNIIPIRPKPYINSILAPLGIKAPKLCIWNTSLFNFIGSTPIIYYTDYCYEF